MPDRPIDDLREWVDYMREIGVRELRVPPVRPSVAARQVAGTRRPAPDPGPPAAVRPKSPAPRPRAAAPGKPSTEQAVLENGVPFDESPPADRAARLAEIRADLGECTRCKLHQGRKNVVFGVGNPGARLMFVGEGPGADEDEQGEPFVGRAGKKLTEMIEAIGLSREEVYIANIVKCRPPGNRDPEKDEIETCTPFLSNQIEAIRPRVIVTLGSPATKHLLATKVGITRLRGHWHSFCGIPVMPTFHPAYLLRSYTPANRRMVWEDLKAARARVGESE